MALHYGVDIRLSKGDTVRAAFDGIVRVTEFDRHGLWQGRGGPTCSGLETIYAIFRGKWSPNQKVRAGEVIGFGEIPAGQRGAICISKCGFMRALRPEPHYRF